MKPPDTSPRPCRVTPEHSERLGRSFFSWTDLQRSRSLSDIDFRPLIFNNFQNLPCLVCYLFYVVYRISKPYSRQTPRFCSNRESRPIPGVLNPAIRRGSLPTDAEKCESGSSYVVRIWNPTVPRRAISPIDTLVLAILLSGVAGLKARAQSSAIETTPPLASKATITGDDSPETAAQNHLPDAPDRQIKGSIYGTVTDPSGNVIAGAGVTLEGESPKTQQVLVTDSTGFFKFSDLPAGAFRVTIRAKGFTDWAGPEIILSPGRFYYLAEIALQVAPANANIDVVYTRYELAELQLKAQERQRILGVVPNFYTTYIWHAAPLTSGQKFRLALRSSNDPVTIAVDGATAGIEQWQNYFSGYGQGAEGYAKRFGATYADDFIGTMIGGAILPALLHQDPRYFYKGTGSVPSRALYAISTVVICRGDNGRWQPNYSNVFGNLAAAGISNLYYPSSNRNGAGVTVDNALIGTAESAVGALLQEFLLKKISRGIQQQPPDSRP